MEEPTSPSKCSHCGYSLAGGDHAACPECGVDPRSPRSNRKSYIAPAGIAGVLVLANVSLFLAASSGTARGAAVPVAFFYGPLVNFVIMLVALGAISGCERRICPPSMFPHKVTAIVGPVVATLVLYIAIATFHGGC